MTGRPASAAFFDAIARRYDREYARGRDETRAGLARVLLELPAASRVLDLGVGTGRELPALLDAGHAPVGLDASPGMLALCAKRTRPVPLVEGDLWAPLPWGDAAFDAVIALHGTLSHPPSSEARAALPGEVARVLRPGGVFVAEVPGAAWLDEAVSQGARGLARTGDGRARYVDAATGASVEVWLLAADAWRQLFQGAMDARVEAIPGGELLIVARRREG